jgi:hypothetical protein
MKLVIFSLFFCISAERPSLAAAASRCRRPRSGQRPRHKDQERANMLITGRRRRRPRRGIIPQTQSAQQRLKHSSAPPSYCRVSCSSKVHRCEGHLATTQMKSVIFSLLSCLSAECPSPAATALRRRRQRSWHRLGHHDLISAHTMKFLRRTWKGAAGNGLSTMNKCL